MATIKINQKLERVEIHKFELDNNVLFNYFNNTPDFERE